MCMDGDVLDSWIWENYETNNFFFHILDVDLKSKLVSCMNMWWTTKNMWRTIKNIQTYSRGFK